MIHRPLEQIGDGRQTNVRVRTDIVVVTRMALHRPKVIKEQERSNGCRTGKGRERRTAKPGESSLKLGGSRSSIGMGQPAKEVVISVLTAASACGSGTSRRRTAAPGVAPR